MKRIVVLGATGSIGRNTADVISRNPDDYELLGIAANRNWQELLNQIERYRPRYAALADAGSALQLEKAIASAGLTTKVLAGRQGLETVAALPEADAVMAAIVGAAGLAPTLAAARAGKRVLLANKESLVMTGPLFLRELKAADAELVPIDSEHNALFQAMPAGYRAGSRPEGVSRLWLTASGGPFRGRGRDQLRDVTPDQACAHPNWVMGRKISVDSATLMNKGLEVIEASYLFGMALEHIEVVVHPQSIIHSMVEYRDGSVLAQLGQPDMRTPIACGLAWPKRCQSGVTPLDIVSLGRLDFEAPDMEAFPCLRLAREALSAGETSPAALNAANEVAVAAFLDQRLSFTAIADVVARTVEATSAVPARDLDTVLAVDQEARRRAGEMIDRLGTAA